MTWYEWLITGYGIVAVLYALRLCQVYFQVLGDAGAGLIITTSIISGLKWPFNILWNGLKETVVAILPPPAAKEVVQVAALPEGMMLNEHLDNVQPTGPMPQGIPSNV